MYEFKPWLYRGYYFDPDINLYIHKKTGYGHTMSYMAKHMQHLRIL